MNYAQVVDGKVVRVGLPDTGTLSNGCTVSGYNLLSTDVLSAEGWLPYTEVIPTYNYDTECLSEPVYDITPEGVTATHTVIPIVFE